MAKRGATTELNHDNWDSVDDDKEEAGSFTPCSATELQNRVIRKAKRSLSKSSGSSNSPGITPFAKFTGFSGNASPFGSAKADASNFNSPFGSAKTDASNFNSPFGPAKTDASKFNSPFGPAKTDASKFNSPFGSAKTDASNFNSPFGNAKTDASKFNSPFGPAKTDVSNFNSPLSITTIKEEKPNGTTAPNSQEKSSDDVKQSSSDAKPQEEQARNLEYYRQLQSLNESVFKWMQLHLTKNPCCDFTPVFNDYKKHMDTLNVTYPVKMKEATSVSEKKPSFTRSSTAEVSKDSTNHSGSSNDNSNTKKEKHEDETDYGANFKSNTTNTSTFSFGIKSSPTPTSSVSSTGCTSSSKEGNDSGNEEKKTPAPFSFGFFSQTANQSNSDKPFSFACAPVAKSEPAENEDAEYVPPKNDFVAVTEEDAIYSKRCKLFFKKGESYAERGVGNLYLKPMDGKTQLLVRADTSLGNILLNIVLSASLPMSRTGKNNVLLVCIPNPPVDAKKADSKEAIPMLIRVKTSDEADELLETLNKHKS